MQTFVIRTDQDFPEILNYKLRILVFIDDCPFVEFLPSRDKAVRSFDVCLSEDDTTNKITSRVIFMWDVVTVWQIFQYIPTVSGTEDGMKYAHVN